MKLRPALKVFLLAFLLLSLQLEARVHPLGHLGERLRAAERGAVACNLPVACATCDVLGGGADTPTSTPAVADLAIDACAVTAVVPATAAIARFVAYLSRAPPALS